MEEQVHPEQLIDRVTTPKGCTIAGLNEMEMHGFSLIDRELKLL
jgi:pyrroline-5-carboxylate reductase